MAACVVGRVRDCVFCIFDESISYCNIPGLACCQGSKISHDLIFSVFEDTALDFLQSLDAE